MLNVEPKNRRRLVGGLLLGLLTVVGLLVVLLVGRGQKPAVTQDEQPPAPVVVPASVAPASVVVESFGPGAYSLAKWSIDDTRTAGWIDTVSVEPGAGLQVSSDDQSLVVSGWAGEISVGIRIPTVILTMCDMVVGAAPVNRPRPDVAGTVHPNLDVSGWQARLLVGHLVRCDGTYLEAWAVYPDSGVLLPLDGRVKISLPPRNPAVSLDRFSARAPVVPEPGARAKSLTITVDSTLVLKRVPGRDSGVINHFAPGRYLAYQLDERDGWLLLVIDGKAGWVPRDSIRVSS